MFAVALPTFGQNKASIMLNYHNPFYDFVENKHLNRFEFQRKYGSKFGSDVAYLSQYIKLCPKEVQYEFSKEIAARQFLIDDRREAFEAMRKKNKKYLKAGIGLIFASSFTEVGLSLMIYKGNKRVSEKYKVTDYEYRENIIKEPLFDNKAKTTAIIVTSAVCGVGFISGAICLNYYVRNIYRYDAGFSLGKDMYVRDKGLGLALTKVF